MEKKFFKVYVFDFFDFKSFDYFEKYKDFLEEDDFSFIKKQKKNEKAFQRLYSRLLVAYALKENKFSFEKIKKDKNNKPYFENLPLKIGISHSETKVAVFLGNVDGSVDIQIKKEIKCKKENRFFCVSDIEKQKNDKFYLCKVFSKNECIYKYGKKIYKNVFFTDFSEKDFFFFTISENTLPKKKNVEYRGFEELLK